MGDVITGPAKWLTAVKQAGVAEVIDQFGAADPFNARLRGAGKAAMNAAREADDRIAAAARRIKAIIAPRHTDPSLLQAFAARVELAAAMHRQLCLEAASLGLGDEQITHDNIAEILETRAAILEASIT